jgi:hypothetical protein
MNSKMLWVCIIVAVVCGPAVLFAPLSWPAAILVALCVSAIRSSDKRRR